MNNEPVVWILKENPQIEGEVIPLYTHPSEHDLGVAEAIGFDKGYKAATAKTLTDEEIRALWNPMPDTKVYVRDLLNFARALLKKASEK